MNLRPGVRLRNAANKLPPEFCLDNISLPDESFDGDNDAKAEAILFWNNEEKPNFLNLTRWLLRNIRHIDEWSTEEAESTPVIPAGENDIDTLEFAAYLALQTPYDDDNLLADFYTHEAFHTPRWFAYQALAGGSAYGQRTAQNRSSRQTYNKLRNPCSLVWTAHVLGEDDDTVISAINAAHAAGSNLSSQCSAVRKIIPFDRIAELYHEQRYKEENDIGQIPRLIEWAFEQADKHLLNHDQVMVWKAFVWDPEIEHNLPMEKYAEFIMVAAKVAGLVTRSADISAYSKGVMTNYRKLLSRYSQLKPVSGQIIHTMYMKLMYEEIQARQDIYDKENFFGSNEPVLPEGDGFTDTFAYVFSELPDMPEAEAFCTDHGIDYYAEQLRMTCWFAAQITTDDGWSSRREPIMSARTTYNNLTDVHSLLWIAVALGEDEAVLSSAADAAKKESDSKMQCDAIRNLIPFSRIYEMAWPAIEALNEEDE